MPGDRHGQPAPWGWHGPFLSIQVNGPRLTLFDHSQDAMFLAVTHTCATGRWLSVLLLERSWRDRSTTRSEHNARHWR